MDSRGSGQLPLGYDEHQMGKSSNRERIARAAEEARLTAVEKAAKKAEKKPARASAKRSAKPVRVKIVWEVWSQTGTVVAVFPYPDKAAAEAKAAALTSSTGRTHGLRGTKVPME